MTTIVAQLGDVSLHRWFAPHRRTHRRRQQHGTFDLQVQRADQIIGDARANLASRFAVVGATIIRSKSPGKFDVRRPADTLASNMS